MRCSRLVRPLNQRSFLHAAVPTSSSSSSSSSSLSYGFNKKQYRSFATFPKLLDIDNDLEIWPKGAINTFLNVCPQGEHRVVERLGRFHRVHSGGWFIAIPILDDIRFCVDMRERTISIAAQSSITKDNVHVEVSGNLYCQFISAEKAAYGSKNPIYAVKQHA